MIYDLLIEPFVTDPHMPRALAAVIAVAISSAPLGVFLILRRMALMGDAMSHAILPGIAIAMLLGGTATWVVALGGLAFGFLITVIAIFISRSTVIKEDASFSGLYLISIAFGVFVMSQTGDSHGHGHEDHAHELEEMLFGNIENIKAQSLYLIAAVASFSILIFALIYRALIIESFDPVYLRAVSGNGQFYHYFFLILVVFNLVSSFQVMGTMMSLGLMILPAAIARLWTTNIDKTICLSVAVAVATGVVGLLISYHVQCPSGPAIVLTNGALYALSIIFGRNGGLLERLLPPKHLAE